MIPAVAYMRCSGLGQGTDTYDRQIEAIRNFAQAEGFEIIAEYREDGIAGKLDKEDRPAFQRMMLEISANGCKTVIAERLDRLARRFGTQESLLTYLIGKGISLFSADSGEDVTDAMMGDPMRRALVQIQGIICELDKNMTIAKLRKARQRLRLANGKCEGRMAYGEKDGEQFVLATILELGKAYTPEYIADYLNNRAVKTRYGKHWHGATIFKILSRHENCPRSAPDSVQAAD